MRLALPSPRADNLTLPGLAANLLLLLVLAHLSFPRARRRTRTFLQLSYFDPSTGLYTQGRDDFFYVAFWVVIFTGLRAAVVSCVLLPLAARAGLRKTKTKVRFAEQAWLLLYYSVMFPLGLVSRQALALTVVPAI